MCQITEHAILCQEQHVRVCGGPLCITKVSQATSECRRDTRYRNAFDDFLPLDWQLWWCVTCMCVTL